VLFENEQTRVWEVMLEPGGRQAWHRHTWPYLVVTLEGSRNRMTWEDGSVREFDEPTGQVVFRDAGKPHMLENLGTTRYRNRLVEFKGQPPPPGGPPAEELLIDTAKLPWQAKSLPGLSQKMLWRNERTGASIALVRFLKGAGIPEPHVHASNQFMYCLSGSYEYTQTGVRLTPDAFYWNPLGNAHGPTVAREESVLLEVYDGPHYPVQPSFYTREEDAH
jgi:quercetin dioxygenase-like cupin family protein